MVWAKHWRGRTIGLGKPQRQRGKPAGRETERRPVCLWGSVFYSLHWPLVQRSAGFIHHNHGPNKVQPRPATRPSGRRRQAPLAGKLAGANFRFGWQFIPPTFAAAQSGPLTANRQPPKATGNPDWQPRVATQPECSRPSGTMSGRVGRSAGHWTESGHSDWKGRRRIQFPRRLFVSTRPFSAHLLRMGPPGAQSASSGPAHLPLCRFCGPLELECAPPEGRPWARSRGWQI